MRAITKQVTSKDRGGPLLKSVRHRRCGPFQPVHRNGGLEAPVGRTDASNLGSEGRRRQGRADSSWPPAWWLICCPSPIFRCNFGGCGGERSGSDGIWSPPGRSVAGKMLHHSYSAQSAAKDSAAAFTLGRISTWANDDRGMANAPQRPPAIAPTSTGQ